MLQYLFIFRPFSFIHYTKTWIYTNIKKQKKKKKKQKKKRHSGLAHPLLSCLSKRTPWLHVNKHKGIVNVEEPWSIELLSPYFLLPERRFPETNSGMLTK